MNPLRFLALDETITLHLYTCTFDSRHLNKSGHVSVKFSRAGYTQTQLKILKVHFLDNLYTE